MQDEVTFRLATTLRAAPYFVEADEITVKTPFSTLDGARYHALVRLKTHRRVVIWRQWPHGPRGRETLADYRNLKVADASR